ncbi:MAG TPA: adenylyl-sulfate kinase [Candidatus Hydrogenedentes bacterium]|nr:adenylyl-sulfate kinase [Candidatus Hydrogenedentota bacterium]HPG67100.1 adenylyl-sulfate kinase [Candidatus Hydrogenedentota bacterium]
MGDEVKSKNITWHQGHITREDRERLSGHKGAVVWFTGLSACGKSTVAVRVEEALFERGFRSMVLDGDNIRHGLNKNLGFSPEDREENIRRIGEVAHLFADAGIIAMTAFISPYRKDRDNARGLEPDRFVEVYVKCAIDVCEERDPKGLYKKARAGQIPEFTGISAPYEEPLNPELVIDTGVETEEESTAKVLACLEAKGIIPKAE